MKTGFAFFIGLLLFSGGGMQGRVGSIIAAFIDPTALTQTGGNNQQPPPPPGDTKKPGPGNTCPSGYEYITRTGKCMQKTILPAGPNHSCPSNYYYDSSSNQCLLLGNPAPL